MPQHPTSRRSWLRSTSLAAAAFAYPSLSRSQAADQSARFFTLEERHGRWWFITPDNHPFFSIALNHIDPAPLRYLSSGGIWNSKYANSMKRWLQQSVAPDLKAWGFNSVGWTQEVVTRGPTNHRHSRPFTYEEYQWLGLPYCHMLPFADFHQWEAETRHPDFASPEFADWCDYVAREHCARMAGDPRLIGYFYIDCPTWIHTRPESSWKGPLFDPARLDTEEGRQQLHDLATRYYRTTHEAIRRYDQNHLILGDRYEAAAPIAVEVVKAALPYVDVLSFQHFSTPDKVRQNLEHWHGLTGKPVLLADQAASTKEPDGTLLHDGAAYALMLDTLREIPACVGYHLCGAYLRNQTRNRGLRDAAEVPNQQALDQITRANHEAQQWMSRAGS